MSDNFEDSVRDSLVTSTPPPKKEGWSGWKNAQMDFGDSWDFDVKTAPVVMGKLVDFRTGIGQYHQNVYNLVDPSGHKWTVWGATALDRELVGESKGANLKFPIGCWLRIEYLGVKTNQKNGRTFKSFDVKSSDVQPPSDE